MSTLAFIVAVIAAVLFGVEALRSGRVALVPLGLCMLTVALIVQFCHPALDVHF